MKKVIRLTESDLTRIVKRVINEGDEWKNVTDRFIRTKGSDFKALDKYCAWNDAKVMKRPNYEYIQGKCSDNGAITIIVRSSGTWTMRHMDTNNVNVPYRQGTWKWDGSKIITERGITKNAKGLFTDSDTDMIKAIYNENKIGNIGARGPIVKKIQNILINQHFVKGNELAKSITKDYDGCKSNWNKCDGIYGQRTKDLLMYVQEYLELPKDGIWGKEIMTYYKNDIPK